MLIVSGSYFNPVVDPYNIVLCVHSTGLESVLWKRLPVVYGKESKVSVTVWVLCRLVHAFFEVVMLFTARCWTSHVGHLPPDIQPI